MPKTYGIKPGSKKVAVSMRLDETLYEEITKLADSADVSNSWTYTQLMEGALRMMALAKDNPKLLEGNEPLENLIKSVEVNRYQYARQQEKQEAKADELSQVQDTLSFLIKEWADKYDTPEAAQAALDKRGLSTIITQYADMPDEVELKITD